MLPLSRYINQRDTTGERSVSFANVVLYYNAHLAERDNLCLCRNRLSSHPLGVAVARLALIWVSGKGFGKDGGLSCWWA